MADRVIQRNDTAARWQSINPVLAQGELGIVSDGAKGYKIGDGVTAWNSLEYPANPASVVQELGNSETAVMSQAGVTSALNSNFKRFRGDTLNRPILTTDDAGYPYYDTTIGKYIVWNGGSWVNLDGTSLD